VALAVHGHTSVLGSVLPYPLGSAGAAAPLPSTVLAAFGLRLARPCTDLEDDILVGGPLGQLAGQLDTDDLRALQLPRQACAMWDVARQRAGVPLPTAHLLVRDLSA